MSLNDCEQEGFKSEDKVGWAAFKIPRPREPSLEVQSRLQLFLLSGTLDLNIHSFVVAPQFVTHPVFIGWSEMGEMERNWSDVNGNVSVRTSMQWVNINSRHSCKNIQFYELL